MASATLDGLTARFGPNYRWLLTLTAMVGNVALIISSTIINVAIPEIMGAFGVGQDKAQWLSAGFFATMTISMLLSAWSVNAFGHRNTYLLSMAVFVTGSVLGGLSPTFDMLVFSRILQGAGAGLIQPLALQVIFEIFPPSQRGRAMGFFGFGVVLAPAIGPMVGGVLVDAFDWRAVFFMVLPFCALGTLMALVFMPVRDAARARTAFDWAGLVLMSVFIGTLLTGLSNGAREGWGSDVILSYFLIAGASITAFIIWEWHCPHPMLNLRLFGNLRFAAACLISLVWGAGIFGLWYLVPLFVQIVQGYTPTRSGLLLMPAGLLLAFIFPLTGRITDWISPRIPILGGMSLAVLSAWLMVQAGRDTPFWLFAWWLIIGRVGLGFVFPALTAGALRSVPQNQVGQGAGLMSYFRQLGAAFGVNLLANLVDSRTAMYADSLFATQTSGNAATAEFLREMQAALARAGTPEPLLLPGAMHELSTTIQAQATMLGFRDAFVAVAVVFTVAMIPAFVLKRRGEG